MGFFSRKRPADGTHTTKHRGEKHGHGEPYSMAKRPSFGQWIKHTWLDILTMAAMGAVGLGVSASLPQFYAARDGPSG